MTIIESVIKAVDETLEKGIAKGQTVFLTSDFPIVLYTRDYSTHAGKTFRKYIRSIGYVMVTANTVDIKSIDSRTIRGNKVVIILRSDFEKYKRSDVINDKLVKKALLEALTVEEVRCIQSVISARLDDFLINLKSVKFSVDMQQSLYRIYGKYRNNDRIAMVVREYVDSLM